MEIRRFAFKSPSRILAAIAFCACFCFALIAQNNATTLIQKKTALTNSDDAPLIESGISAKAMGLYRRAVRDLHANRPAQAQQEALQAVKRSPNFADAEALAATAALQQRQFMRAQSEALTGARLNAKDEKTWVILATADNYLGQYAEAATALRHVRAADRVTWQVDYQWARAEAGLGNGNEALDWASRAARTAPPEFARLHLLRASALLALHRYGEAAAQLQTYLQLMGANAPRRNALLDEAQQLRQLAEKDRIAQTSSISVPHNVPAN